MILACAAGGFAAGRLIDAWQARTGGGGRDAGAGRSEALERVLRAQEQRDGPALERALEALVAHSGGALPAEARLCEMLVQGDSAGLETLAAGTASDAVSARASLYLLRQTQDAEQRVTARAAFLVRYPSSWLRRRWRTEAGP